MNKMLITHVFTVYLNNIPYLLQEDDVGTVSEFFPFTKYFENAPQPLFKNETYAEDMDIAEGCFRHINKIFTQLEASILTKHLKTFHTAKTGFVHAATYSNIFPKINRLWSQYLRYTKLH